MLEILAPAGNAACAEAAINNGANAIYLGLSAFSARQSAGNFDGAAFRAVLQKAHFCGVKVYVAMNTLVKDGELDAFLNELLLTWNEGADAIILQDALLGKYIHETYPEIVLHLSTQAGVCNVSGARFAKECGFSRVILARETPIKEMREIASFIETEAFVQGALCTCFSGQCYFSSFAGGNSGNRGRCKQPCRKQYAYDRNGNTEKNYALSLSDLSVGEDIRKYIEAGIVSFKIEGRMRREEYVAAATRYYRKLLDGADSVGMELSDLKRTYNRGNYTKGLAFGQDKRFLSPAVQGHLGEKVGVVKVINGKFFVESFFIPRQGDAFKILREGKEIGGAAFVKTEGKGFVICSRFRLKNGDGVFVTTDTAVNEKLLQGTKRRKITLNLWFHEGKTPVAECEDLSFTDGKPLQSAQSRPLSEEELKSCFLKTDGLPVDVEFGKIDLKGNVFIPKSELNAFRRAFYSALWEATARDEQRALERIPFSRMEVKGRNDKLAVIADDFEGVHADVAVYKPSDYNALLPVSFLNGNFERYIFYPAFCMTADEQAIGAMLKQGKIDGLYVENYAGIAFAETHGLKIFAGTGLNLFNGLSVSVLLQNEKVCYYALSKELNEAELRSLSGERAFVLASGDIRVMDLCYCPFGKTCGVCDKKQAYTLTDENGREFPVRRVLSAEGNCRFEVYNCATLVGVGINGAGKLLDLSLTKDKAAAIAACGNAEAQKRIVKNYTSGHFKRGVL